MDPAVPDPLAGMGLVDPEGRAKESSLTWRIYAERPPEG
jgi:hypothetical protein